MFVELKKRFRALLIITSEDLDDDTETFNYAFHGGLMTAIGLAEKAKYRLLRDDGEDNQVNI